MTINADLANKIRTIIDMRPDNHDQGSWFYVYEGDKGKLSPDDVHVVELLAEVQEAEQNGKDYRDFEPSVSCAATLCVAGWACILEGYTLTEDDNETVVAEKDGVQTKVQEKAAELLGLDDDLANWLFCRTDDEMAIEALDELSDGEIPTDFRYEESEECPCCRYDDRDDYYY